MNKGEAALAPRQYSPIQRFIDSLMRTSSYSSCVGKKPDMKNLAILLILVVVAGCASSTAVRTGKTYPPLAPSEVEVFLEPPQFKYEVVGLVSGHSVLGWTQQSDSEKAFENLREQTAKLGANGVIVTSVLGPSSQNVGYGVTSTGQTATFFSGGASSEATVSGKAIYYKR